MVICIRLFRQDASDSRSGPDPRPMPHQPSPCRFHHTSVKFRLKPKESFVNLSLSRSQRQMRIYFKDIIDSAASRSRYPGMTGQRDAVEGSRASERCTASRFHLSIETAALFRREDFLNVRFRFRKETVRCARTFNNRPFHPTIRRPDPIPFRPPRQAGE
jgi:hypothetical protein